MRKIKLPFIILGITILFYIVSFLITEIINPSHYLISYRRHLLNPLSVSLIPPGTIIIKAVQHSIPWVIASPWTISAYNSISRTTLNGDDMFAGLRLVSAIFFFPFYALFFTAIAGIFTTPQKTKRMILLIAAIIPWAAISTFGIYTIYQENVIPKLKLNTYLNQLAEISGKNPLPPNTDGNDSDWNTKHETSEWPTNFENKGYSSYNATRFKFTYASDEDVRIFFAPNPIPNVFEKMKSDCKPSPSICDVLKKGSSDCHIFDQTKIYPLGSDKAAACLHRSLNHDFKGTAEITSFGFLDKDKKIFVIIQNARYPLRNPFGEIRKTWTTQAEMDEVTTQIKVLEQEPPNKIFQDSLTDELDKMKSFFDYYSK